MDRLTPISDQKIDYDHPDPALESNQLKKSNKINKPPSSEDRSFPQMKSRSTGGNPLVSTSQQVDLGSTKNSTGIEIPSEEKKLAKFATFSKKSLGNDDIDERFDRLDKYLEAIDLSKPDDLKKLAAFSVKLDEDDLFIVAGLVEDIDPNSGFLELMTRDAVKRGDADCFDRIWRAGKRFIDSKGISTILKLLDEPDRAETEVRHGISMVKTLLKSGIRFDQSESEKIMTWQEKLKDHDLRKLILDIEKNGGVRPNRLNPSSIDAELEILAKHMASKVPDLAVVFKTLYKLADASDDKSLKSIVAFMGKYGGITLENLLGEALGTGNHELFKRLIKADPSDFYKMGIRCIVSALHRIADNSLEKHTAIFYLKVLLTKNCECESYVLRELNRWSDWLGDEELSNLIRATQENISQST